MSSPDCGNPSPDCRNPSPDCRNLSPDCGNPSPDCRNPSPDCRNPSPDCRNLSPDCRNPSPGCRNPSPGCRNLSPDCGNPSPDCGNPSPFPLPASGEGVSRSDGGGVPQASGSRCAPRGGQRSGGAVLIAPHRHGARSRTISPHPRHIRSATPPAGRSVTSPSGILRCAQDDEGGCVPRPLIPDFPRWRVGLPARFRYFRISPTSRMSDWP